MQIPRLDFTPSKELAMRMSIRWGTRVLALLLIVTAVPVRADESPLTQIPAKTPLILQISGLDKARNRLGKLINNDDNCR